MSGAYLQDDREGSMNYYTT